MKKMFNVSLHLQVAADNIGAAGFPLVRAVTGMDGVEIRSVTFDTSHSGPYEKAAAMVSDGYGRQPAGVEVEDPEEPAAEAIVALPDDIPYVVTLRKSGLTLDEIEKHAAAGTLTDIKGIGDSGAEKISEYFGIGQDDGEASGDEGDLGELFGGAAPAGEEEYTADDIRAALAAVGQQHGINAVRKIVKDVGGAATVPDIDPHKYAAVMAACAEA